MIRSTIITLTALIVMSGTSCIEKKYAKYQCPMKCEKEKTYAAAGKCPVCGMKLKGIE